MGTTVLVRPDGSTLRVDDTDVPTLTSLGYKPQSEESERAGDIQSTFKDYYSQPSQRALTGIQGVASGASFGLSDLFSDDEESRNRAKYNPGYRLGGELLGGFLAPVGPIGDAAEVLTEGATLGKTATAAVRGAAEGAAFGAGGAITTAKLNGDPLTAEAILAGAGWGSVWGGGLSAAFSKSADLLEGASARASRAGEMTHDFNPAASDAKATLDRELGDAQAQSAVREGIKDRNIAIDGLGDLHYRQFKGTIDDARGEISKALDTVKEVTADNVTPNFSDLKAANNQVYNWLTAGGAINEVRDTARGAERSLKAALKSGYDGNYPRMASNLEAYKAAIGEMGAKFGENFPSAAVSPHIDEMLTFAKDRFSRAGNAADTLTTLTALRNELDGLPHHTKGFMAMTAGKIEKIGAAIDSLDKLPAAEFTGLKEGITQGLEKWSERLGMTVEGEKVTPGTTFRKIHETLHEAGKTRSIEEADAIASGKKSWAKVSKAENDYLTSRMQDPVALRKGGPGLGKSALSFAAGIAAEEGAKKVGAHGFMRYGAYVLGKHTASALLGLKGAVMGHIADSVKAWGPGVMRRAATITPRAEPLARRISGEMDTEYKNKAELMGRRAEEIRSAAPTVRDVLYRNISPFGAEHPELAGAMHDLAAQQFAFILNKLPTDPGGAYSQLKTLWNPTSADALKFERYYAVFHNPVGEISTALRTGKVTPELTEALREMYPQLYSEMKADMIMRLSDPTVWKSMTYPEQVNVGLLLGFPVHSTMSSKFIASQSQMFKERNDPQGIKPQASAASMGGGGGGRPPGPGSTQSQKITEH